ncbi:MAG: ComEC/Rec2 family competence protein, partial [Candidatus Doudnabacteria bacterium]
MNKSSIFVWGISFFLLGSFIGVSKQTGLIFPLVVFLFVLFYSFEFKKRSLVISSIFLSFFLFGFFKAEISSWEQSKYLKYYDKRVFFKATITKDPETYKQKFKRITLKPDGLDQMLLTTFFTRDQYFYGDHVFVSGKIKEPRSDDDFNYKRYLQSKNIYAQISSPEIFVLTKASGFTLNSNPAIFWSLKFKHWVYKQFQDKLPKEQAGLLVSLLVGQKELLSEQTITEFTKAGLAHIIAVSGFTLTLILLFCNKLGAYIGKKKAWAICLAVAFLYIVMADFAAGVIRAALMSGIFVFGKSLGRQYALLPALALTAGVLVFL